MYKADIIKKIINNKKSNYYKNVCGELVIEEDFLNSIYVNKKWNYISKKIYFCRKNNVYFTGCNDFYECSYLVKNTDMYIFALIKGPYERAFNKLGFKELMIGFLKDEEKIKEILNEVKNEILQDIFSFYKMGVHGIMLGDDIAYDKGLLFSLDLFNKFFREIYKEIVAYSQKLFLEIIFHCCGKIDDLIYLVKICGFNGIHGFDKWSNKNFFNEFYNQPKNFVFMGGFDFYENKDMDLIKNKIFVLKNYISKGYPYLICSSGGLMKGYDYEWVCKILKEIRS